MPISVVSPFASGVRMPPYAGLLTGFLAPGSREINHLSTLGKCYIPRHVPRIRVSDGCKHHWAVNRLRNLIFFFTVHSPGIKWKRNSVNLCFYYLLSKIYVDRIIRQAELTSTCMCTTARASISRHIIYSARKMAGLFVSVVGKSHFFVIEF